MDLEQYSPGIIITTNGLNGGVAKLVGKAVKNYWVCEKDGRQPCVKNVDQATQAGLFDCLKRRLNCKNVTDVKNETDLEKSLHSNKTNSKNSKNSELNDKISCLGCNNTVRA